MLLLPHAHVICADIPQIRLEFTLMKGVLEPVAVGFIEQ